MFGLRRSDIDLDAQTVTVELQRQQLANGQHVIGPPKSDAGRRTLALPPEAFDALVEHLGLLHRCPAGCVGLHRAKGGPLREAVWQHEWAAARAPVGVPQLHFHDLRHVAATLAAATGADVKEIMYRIGHSSPQAALRYQHATARRDSAIAEGISNVIQRERSAPAKTPNSDRWVTPAYSGATKAPVD